MAESILPTTTTWTLQDVASEALEHNHRATLFIDAMVAWAEKSDCRINSYDVRNFLELLRQEVERFGAAMTEVLEPGERVR